MKNRYSLLCCIFLLTVANPAHAQFALSEMIIDFADSKPRQHDVEIISRSKEVQYIATETHLVENPTQPDEKRTTITDPVKSGLLITPNKMALSPDARKMMRFLLIKPQGEKDIIYRVTVKPVVKGVDAGNQKIALKILVGYDALVIVRPKMAKVDLVAERKGNSLKLTNNGNTNALLRSGQQCDNAGSNCKELNVSRIYAGQSWTTTLPYMDGAVKYQMWDGNESKNLTY